MTALAAIFARLALDLASNALAAAVERAFELADAHLHTPAQRDAARAARERAAIDARCDRYVARVREQRGCS